LSASGQKRGIRAVVAQVRTLVDAIQAGDDAAVEEAVLDLSRRKRIFAPLGLIVGGFAMVFDGLRLVFSNWRLTLVQVLPAMWIWLAMYDVKAHLFRGRSFHPMHGWNLLLGVAVITVVTAASFFLNAVFAYAIAHPGGPRIRPAFAQARAHAPLVLGSGLVVGLMLAFAALYANRWGTRWFAITMSIAVGIMMVAYVALPSRLIGMRTTYSRSEKLKASLVSGAFGALVCSPPYALGRIGVLMLGSKALFVPGIILLSFGFTLQAGATGAVKAIKMSSKLVAGHSLEPSP